MARFSFTLLFLSIVALTLSAPLHRRQQGNLECNLARLRIISEVKATEDAVAQIDTTELKTAAAVGVAQAGLKSIDDAIQDILTAVFNNEAAPADSRDQVSEGANVVKIALDSITDPSANATVAVAVEKLIAAGAAGDDVVALCK
ncbi:hypothetical protein C8J57DRAFT_1471489 [Mycena rebaudengoi]|nr:hypothetical protein C8J57DRAFT_1728737 [Mycena rebaudengoi]KAJ7261012.1 hypothetical protein C8J57DRAFT_1471489 [Mycena rebaudengoi]